MALGDQVSLANTVSFQGVVRVSIVEASRTYIDAGQATSATQARYQLAQAVLLDGGNARLSPFVWAFASVNTVTQANFSDAGRLTGLMPGVWNNLAGLSNGVA